MLIIITLPLMKQIKLFLSLIVKTLDGKLMFVNCKSITLNMDPIVKSQSIWHKFLVQQRLKLKKLHLHKERLRSKPKLKSSVKKLMISKRFLRKFNNGARLTKMLKTFQTRLFQKTITLETLKDTISLVKLEIKDHVAPAILYPSLRSLNQD